MAALSEKVQNALQETRILVLGSQIFFGFQFHAFFQDRFEHLPAESRHLLLAGLVLTLVTVALLVMTGAHHRIAEGGKDSPGLLSLASIIVSWALLPMLAAVAIDIHVVAGQVVGGGAALAMAAGMSLVGLALWYGLTFAVRAVRHPPPNDEEPGVHDTELKDKINHLLTETRVILPGAQALLGFQFTVVLTQTFERLPPDSRLLHITSLLMVALAVVLLLTPSAYHRIVDRGEDTSDFHAFGSVVVVLALVPLALGLCGDLFVVARIVLGEVAPALAVSLSMFLLLMVLWFVVPYWRRVRRGW